MPDAEDLLMIAVPLMAFGVFPYALASYMARRSHKDQRT